MVERDGKTDLNILADFVEERDGALFFFDDVSVNLPAYMGMGQLVSKERNLVAKITNFGDFYRGEHEAKN